MDTCGQTRFPLFERARSAGVLETGNALIVAPTATGKSYIGRLILRSAARRHEPGVHVYLVPYRALAAEVFDSFQEELTADGVQARVKIATGDHTDPIYPQETDILVATYERFAALLRMPDLSVGRVVADEIHLIADETRGSVVEGLLARLRFHKRPTSLCALSAVISNPEKLGEWLELPVILGKATDRTVEVEFRCAVTPDIDGKLAAELREVLEKGEQAIIFCRSKPASQRVARDLRETVERFLTEENKDNLRALAHEMAEDDEDAQDLLNLLSGGIAFHHAGLSRESRRAVETAFRNRDLKAIACTPTLAAGVNLPARLVVVRDVFRTEFVRGFPQQVILSTGELLNMLGRAGRPGQVERGRGIALVKSGSLEEDELGRLQVAIGEGRGDPVRSRLPDSFDSLMRFILAVAADRGECTMADLATAIQHTLWYHEDPREISFDREFSADIMEDIPSFERVNDDIWLKDAWVVADGVAGEVVSGSKVYTFSLSLTGERCSCPAKSKWRPREVCKHLACAIHHLLFGAGVDQEIQSRAIYVAAHRFRKTLDLGTKIRVAVNLLRSWGLLEHVPGAIRATALGELAATSGLDLLLIRTANDRIKSYSKVPTVREVAAWVIEDYFADESKRHRWLQAADAWLSEVDVKRFKLPERYRGDFERGLEELGRLATLYAEIAESLGKPEVADVCRVTRGCLQYGVAPELIPLAALRIPQLGRARCRFLYSEKGIRSLEDLAEADPSRIAGPTAPLALTRQWVEAAQRILSAKKQIATRPKHERRQEIDDLLGRFRVDQLMLFDELDDANTDT